MFPCCSLNNNHLHRLHFRIILLFLSVILIYHCAADQLSFNYTSFSANSARIMYYGDAAPDDPAIQLNTPTTNQIGRVTYYETMQLWDKASNKMADFSSHFSFAINSENRSAYADGLAFFLAPEGFGLPEQGNGISVGGGIGLVRTDGQYYNSTSNPFVAVEFDTFVNLWDPNYTHVGININSMVSVKSSSWSGNILTGQRNEAWISYNSSTKTFSIVFTSSTHNRTFLDHLYEIVDLRQYLPERVIFGFSAGTGAGFEKHTLYSWDFISNLENHRKGKNERLRLLIILGLCVVATVLVCVLLFHLCRKKIKKIGSRYKHAFRDSHIAENGKLGTAIPFEKLVAATNNFAEEKVIGTGGSGKVYRASLDGSEVAIKRIPNTSEEAREQYKAEVKTVSSLVHRYVVELVGWCHEGEDLLVVYPFMENGSLDSYLFNGSKSLPWAARFSIAKSLAWALNYLQEGCGRCVLHRDIKSSNILLNARFIPQLGDFGLARVVDHEKGSKTTLPSGTPAYMAPEYVMTHKASKKTDVYSFGVVALEIACGRKAIFSMDGIGQTGLVDYVWELCGRQKLSEAIDPKLFSDITNAEEEMICLLVVGLWCAHPDHKDRPSIYQAIQVLNFEAPLPSLPPTKPRLNVCILEPMNSPEVSSSSALTSNAQ